MNFVMYENNWNLTDFNNYAVKMYFYFLQEEMYYNEIINSFFVFSLVCSILIWIGFIFGCYNYRIMIFNNIYIYSFSLIILIYLRIMAIQCAEIRDFYYYSYIKD